MVYCVRAALGPAAQSGTFSTNSLKLKLHLSMRWWHTSKRFP